MTRDLEIIELTIAEDTLKRLENRRRNQVIGCMHAHNELVVLNRILMFSMNPTSEGNLHDSAQAVQMWCLLQLLAAKLYETWKMLDERFLEASPEDEALGSLSKEH